ncbi:hypothetical protein ACIRL2_45460 [Embleya sp. NPDC127516]|uniref:hypothetical protein n=1 Tax=Embleya sp. NPDC127516 TaxID=3363990 RepID=UPI00381F10F7
MPPIVAEVEDVLEVGARGEDFTDEGGVGVEGVVDEVRAVAVLGGGAAGPQRNGGRCWGWRWYSP